MSDALRQVARFSEPRLAYHPLVKERFGIDLAGWRALIDAVWPAAKSADAVVLALSYCKARNLDPFKRPVHIVPVWSEEAGRVVESVWPGIGELRTTAFRTGLYAGRDPTTFGPERTLRLGDTDVTFPEWAQTTVYRIAKNGDARPYPGPRVYWMETYATAKRNTLAPNRMWMKRPHGQLDKCSEAAALRAAFPEEIGDQRTDDEMTGQVVEHQPTAPLPPRPRREDFREAVPVPGEEPGGSEGGDGEEHESPPPAPPAQTWTVTLPYGELREFDDVNKAFLILSRALLDAENQTALDALFLDNTAMIDTLPSPLPRELAELAREVATRLATKKSDPDSEHPAPDRPSEAMDADPSPLEDTTLEYAVGPVPIRGSRGALDYRTWAIALFMPRARRAKTRAEFELLRYHNIDNLEAYKGTLMTQALRIEFDTELAKIMEALPDV